MHHSSYISYTPLLFIWSSSKSMCGRSDGMCWQVYLLTACCHSTLHSHLSSEYTQLSIMIKLKDVLQHKNCHAKMPTMSIQAIVPPTLQVSLFFRDWLGRYTKIANACFVTNECVLLRSVAIFRGNWQLVDEKHIHHLHSHSETHISP